MISPPSHYDQHYFARRVRELGIGAAHPPAVPATDSLTATLSHTRRPEVAARAKAIADAVRTDAAQVAARRLMTAVSPGCP
jgi:vancomycin aglycone glucosyltransferase